MTVDLYDILGVDRNADEREIKRAFRRLAKEYHPDHNPEDPNAEQRFKEVLAAFEILSDPEQRRRYDRYGFEGLESPDKASFRDGAERPDSDDEPWWAAGSDIGENASEIFGDENPFDFSYFEEIGEFDFSETFDREFGEVARDGDDVVRQLEVGLVDAVRGAEVEVEIDGSAATIELEPGIRTGERMRVPGRGEPAPDDDGEPGDLVLEIEVADHSGIRRDALDLEMDVPVTVAEATLGATIEIPTPWGAVEVEVPSGIDSGARLRLNGLGVRRDGERGDLYAILEVVTPNEIDESSREAARTLEEAYDRDVRSGLRLRGSDPSDE